MTKRHIGTYEACLKAFSIELKNEIKENLKTWQTLNIEAATVRQQAYAHVVFHLKMKAQEFNIPLEDLGLAGYEVPKIEI